MTIKELQNIGLSLEEISSFLKQNSHSDIMQGLDALLAKQERAILSQIHNLSQMLEDVKKIQAQCGIITKYANNNSNNIMIKNIPQRTVIYKEYTGKYKAAVFGESYKSIMDSLENSQIDLDNIVPWSLAIFLQPIQTSEHVTIKIGYEVVSQNSFGNFLKFELSSGLYACYVHRGNYAKLRETSYSTLFEEIEKLGFMPLSPFLEVYYVNEVITDIDDNLLTEIQIPIKL